MPKCNAYPLTMCYVHFIKHKKKTIVIAHAKLDLRDLKATTFVSLPHTSADIVTVLHLELDAGNYEKCHFRSA